MYIVDILEPITKITFKLNLILMFNIYVKSITLFLKGNRLLLLLLFMRYECSI